MKVGELIDILKNYHDETVVVISEDAEGNTLSPLCEVGLSRLAHVSDWYVDFDEESGTDMVVMWPVN